MEEGTGKDNIFIRDNLQALWLSQCFQHWDVHPFGDEGEQEKEEEEFEFTLTSLCLQLPNTQRVIIRKEKFVCASAET